MMLKGIDALAEFVNRLAYDTESGKFFVDANDLAVGNSTKTPHSEEHGEKAERYVLVNEGGLQGQIALHSHS